ncbi:UDP-glycosyltransferase UGT5-like isoform X2 [Macrobrachium nipponense]|uniref:UDP-glycosyltransferase UGT5-like isoform X2 n=1 Tax=Macrobrachium nipponense TaxID=159736 RepID=UPI0030C7CC7C
MQHSTKKRKTCNRLSLSKSDTELLTRFIKMKWPSVLFWLMLTGTGGAKLLPPERSYKILMLLPIGSRSHRNVFMPLAEALADRGHKVDMLTSYDIQHQNPNIREIPHGLPHYPRATINMFSDANTVLGIFHTLGDKMQKMARDIYQVPRVRELYKKRKEYDVIVVNNLFNEFMYPFVHERPFIAMATAGMDPRQSAVLGNILSPAYVPTLFYESNCGHVFGRLANAIASVVKPFYWRNWEIIPAIQKEGLESWIEGAGSAGVIYFSLGSVTKGNTLPNKYRHMFIEAFSKLNQRILWKFETDLERTPGNIMISPWLPQQDILGHPNVKVFISHGGLLSLQETLYHGTPMVALPLFGDQPTNGARVVANSWGLSLNYEDLSVDLIISSLEEVINNTKYKENVAKTSRLYKDQLNSPVERAVFWTEYVIRHRGAPKLRSPAASLSWVQLLLLDVLALFLLVIILSLIILHWIFKKVIGVVLVKRI